MKADRIKIVTTGQLTILGRPACIALDQCELVATVFKVLDLFN